MDKNNFTITETKDLLTKNCLKPIRENIKKYSIFGFDIETYGKHNKFLMGSIYGENKKYVFWDKKEMQDFILSSHIFRGEVLFFATNLGFDFLSLFDDRLIDTNIEFILRGTNFINIKITLKSGHIINFRDTLNFLKASVENIGKKILGIEKLKKPKCLGLKPKNEMERKELEIYNIRDSEITYKFSNFLQDSFNDLGTNIKFTIASTSMNLFKCKYLKENIYQPNRRVLEFLFKAYYGGRTEIIQRGKIKNLKYYDINSLYPYVMGNNEYPHPNSIKEIDYHNKNCNLYNLKNNKNYLDYILNFEGVTKCIIRPNYTKDNKIMQDFPLLPNRDDYRGKLIFSNEKLLGYHTHIELRKALYLGYSIAPLKTIYYDKTFSPFKDFVTDLYKKRLIALKNNSPMQLVYKITLNSLYGKFAQKMEYQEIVINNNSENYEKIKKIVAVNYNREKQNMDLRYKIDVVDTCKIKHDTGEIISPQIYYITDLEREYIPKFINPILSIYTTSFARLELYKLIEKVARNNKKVFYFDTDSIITDDTLETSKNLGDLKKEYDIIEGILVKPKMYYFKGINEKGEKEDIFKCKGLMGIKSYKEFSDLLDTKKYSYTKFAKFKESIRRSIYFNEKMIIDKIINLEDNKRDWGDKEFNKDELQESKPIYIS